MNDETSSRRQFVQATVAAVGGLAVAGCSGDGGSDSGGTPTSESGGAAGGEWTQTSTVEMTDSLTYEPKKIQVSVGTTVTWENVGAVGHTVTAYEDEIPDDATYFASGGFDSESAAKEGWNSGTKGSIGGGETYEHTFETPGEYKYYCIPHESGDMVGSVKVVE